MIYLIQNQGLDWTKGRRQSWTIERDGVSVTTIYESQLKDVLGQVLEEKMTLEVDDKGRRMKLVHRENMNILKKVFKH